MIRKALFTSFLVLLAIILFFNPNFKTISAGIAILLFGMIMLEEGFKVFTKGPLQGFLKNATNKLYKSITAGALVTALIQSSSATIGILQTIYSEAEGNFPLISAVAILFGNNIGTTVSPSQ